MAMLKNIATLYQKMKSRRRKSWDEVSTPVIFTLAVICWIEAGYYGYAMGSVGPEYIKLLNQVSSMPSVPFLVISVIFGFIGISLFIWGFMAKCMTSLLEKRFFSV